MKKYLIISFAFISFIILGIIVNETGFHFAKEKPEVSAENEPLEKRAEMVAARLQYEYALLKDPKTGLIPKNIRQQEIAMAKTLPIAGMHPQSISRNGLSPSSNGINTPTNNTYQLAGPNNIGGRTRTMAFDKRYNGSTNRVMIAGCVSGGIMRSADGGNSWTLVTPEQQIHSITTIAQDTRTGFEDIWYAGTGESLGNTARGTGAFYFGNGRYKSTNNGLSWTALPSTQSGTLAGFDNPFDLIHRIAVNPANGDVFAACQSSIQRSQNGGATWSVVVGCVVAG